MRPRVYINQKHYRPGGTEGESKRGRDIRKGRRAPQEPRRAEHTEKPSSGRLVGGGKVRESMNYSLPLLPCT